MAASRRGPKGPRAKSQAATSPEAPSQSVADAVLALAASDPIQAGNWGAWKLSLYTGEVVRVAQLGAEDENQYSRLLSLLRELGALVYAVESLPTEVTVAYHRANPTAVQVGDRFFASYFDAAIGTARKVLHSALISRSVDELLQLRGALPSNFVTSGTIDRIKTLTPTSTELDRLSIELEKEYVRLLHELGDKPPSESDISEGLEPRDFQILAAIQQMERELRLPIDVEVATLVDITVKTLQKRYKPLQDRQLIAPPHGKKRGRVLTNLGRRALKSFTSP